MSAFLNRLKSKHLATAKADLLAECKKMAEIFKKAGLKGVDVEPSTPMVQYVLDDGTFIIMKPSAHGPDDKD